MEIFNAIKFTINENPNTNRTGTSVVELNGPGDFGGYVPLQAHRADSEWTPVVFVLL